MAKQNKPAIRFKGFTDAWEQRKAKELCNIGTGKSNTQDQVEDGIYPFYIRSDIPVKSNKYLYDCEAVITIGDGNIGRVFHYVNGKFDLHQRCYKMTDFQDIWGKYFYYFFSTRFYDRAMKMTAKATVDSVRLEMISEMDIWKPTAIDEQKKIAEFFANLDHLITLHQRKYDKLQVLKKAMLEKMFPKNGSSVPEIRFKGFTDAWEQRKVGEVANVYDGVHQTPNYTDSGIMFLSVENIGTLKSEKYISEEAFNHDYKVYPQKGDILMTRIGDVGTPNVVETSEKIAFYVSLALLKPCNVDSYFLCNSILSPFFQRGLKERTLITAIPQKINKDEIGKVDLVLPASTDEQQVIGAFFQQLDNLITLHQRELEKLKNLKKACLEKMFV